MVPGTCSSLKNHEERIQELEKSVQTKDFYNKFIPYENAINNKKTSFDIDGYIEADENVDEDTFYSEFQDWLDSKGWSFVSVTRVPEE